MADYFLSLKKKEETDKVERILVQNVGCVVYIEGSVFFLEGVSYTPQNRGFAMDNLIAGFTPGTWSDIRIGEQHG